MLEEGSFTFAAAAAFVLLGGLLVETRVLLRLRPSWYFLLGVPVLPPVVPIPSAPSGSGATETVKWEVVAPGVVFWWADPKRRTAPTGLHGVVMLAQTHDGAVSLQVRCAPPLSPLVAALWLGLLGAARGEAHVTVPIATVMVLGIGLLYYERARRAARELRWSFVRGDRG